MAKRICGVDVLVCGIELGSVKVLLHKAPGVPVTYYWDGILMRRWQLQVNGNVLAVHQLVLPSAYRPQVLKLANEHPLSGHLGITKT